CPCATGPALGPRWAPSAYNRADFHRLAAARGGLPRPARLALARRLGRFAPRRMPAERAAVRNTLARVTGAMGSRLEALTVATFTDFAMCFSDLVSTNRQPMARLVSHVAITNDAERIIRPDGGFISPSAHVGNWELAGRLLAGPTARTTHGVLAGAVGVPMVPAFCLLAADYRYVVKVAEPITVTRGGEEEAARAWVAVLEDVVRKHPTQWFNFFDIWNPLPA